jgi:hypothetical protein
MHQARDFLGNPRLIIANLIDAHLKRFIAAGKLIHAGAYVFEAIEFEPDLVPEFCRRHTKL